MLLQRKNKIYNFLFMASYILKFGYHFSDANNSLHSSINNSLFAKTEPMLDSIIRDMESNQIISVNELKRLKQNITENEYKLLNTSTRLNSLMLNKQNQITELKKAIHLKEKKPIIIEKPVIYLSLFQSPPKPLEIWPALPPTLKKNFMRPKSWEEKNFGQWCRNFTVNKHTQCPKATPFHWYVCCGKDNVECCGGPQTWVYLIFGFNFVQLSIVFLFYILLHYNVILCSDKDKLEKEKIDSIEDCERCIPAGCISRSPFRSYQEIKRSRKDDDSACDVSLLHISTLTPLSSTDAVTKSFTTITTSGTISPTSIESYDGGSLPKIIDRKPNILPLVSETKTHY